MISARIVIVGAGFAGASTAWWLKQRGESDVLVLEREPAPGLQASGQNAAMARQSTGDPVLTKLLAEGVRFMAAPPKEFQTDRPILRRAGSALLGSESLVGKMAEGLRSVLSSEDFEVGAPDRLGAIPYVSRTDAPLALYTRSDGYIDLQALLGGFLYGIKVKTNCELKSAVRDKDAWVLRTPEGDIGCSVLVLAAGAWSSLSSAAVGGSVMPLKPTTRHLFQSTRQPEFQREAPFVWDMRSECYVRPDGGGGLFLSSCDQDAYDPKKPLKPDLKMMGQLRGKLSVSFPKLSQVRFKRFWCGTRVLTPDGRFLIGPDPKMENLFWAAGLGGHGVTSSPAVGRIVADSILGLKSVLPELSCQRFG